jgi:hypothetical protein
MRAIKLSKKTKQLCDFCNKLGIVTLRLSAYDSDSHTFCKNHFKALKNTIAKADKQERENDKSN